MLTRVSDGAHADSFRQSIIDGNFGDCSFIAVPKDSREFIMWRYRKDGKPGAEFSRSEKLTFDTQPEWGSDMKTELEAVFGVAHYQVACEIVNGSGEIKGLQPPTWKDLTVDGNKMITNSVPKTTEDSPGKNKVDFSIMQGGKLQLDFKGKDGSKLVMLNLDGKLVAPTPTGTTGNSWTYDLGQLDGGHSVKAWFSKEPAGMVKLSLFAAPKSGGTCECANGVLVERATEITLKATPNPGYTFKGWDVSVGKADIDEEKSATTTAVLRQDSEIWAIFKKLKQGAHSVTVNGGTSAPKSAAGTFAARRGVASGEYLPGTEVELLASMTSPGKTFQQWQASSSEAGGHKLSMEWDTTLIKTSFVMPDCDLVIDAEWIDGPADDGSFSLIVLDGSGSGDYMPGSQVPIQADDLGSGMNFAGWRIFDPFNKCDYEIGDLVDSPASASANLIMPDFSVCVMAEYTCSTAAPDGTKLLVKSDDFKAGTDKASIRKFGLPAGFSLTADQRDSLELCLDKQAFDLGALGGTWSGADNSVFATVKGSVPELKLRFDFAKLTCDFEAARFNACGQIGNQDAAVKLSFVSGESILFASEVKSVAKTADWQYSPDLSATPSVALGVDTEAQFGFIAKGSKITGRFRGDAIDAGRLSVTAKRMTMGLPQGVDLPGNGATLCLDALQLPLTFTSFSGKTGIYTAKLSGATSGTVRLNVKRDECGFSIKTTDSALVDISDGLDVTLQVGDYVGVLRIYPKQKMTLRR